MARVDAVEVAVGLKEGFLKRHRKDRARAEAAWAGLVRAGRGLREDPFLGTQVPKDRFPRAYRAYDNLWKLDLPSGFRAVYTVLGRSGGGVRVAVEWIGDHQEYSARSGACGDAPPKKLKARARHRAAGGDDVTEDSRRSLATLVMALLAALPAAGPVLPGARADYAAPVEARLPFAYANMASFWDGSHAYLLGGRGDAPGFVDAIVRYHPGTDSVVVLDTKLPTRRDAMAWVWTGSEAYFFGGFDFAVLDQVLRFTPSTGELKVMGAKLPVALVWSTAAWDGKHAYLFGGADSGWRNRDLILRYDPATDSFQTMSARLPSVGSGRSAVSDGTHIYVFGGADLACNQDILRYDPATDAIAKLDANLPAPLWASRAVWTGSVAYFFGGGCAVEERRIARFDPATGTAEAVHAQLPTRRVGAGAVWDGSHAYVFGGEPGGSDDILRYDELRPSAPRALSATPGAGPGEVTLAWLAPDHASEDGVSSYKVYRGTSPGQLGFLAEVGAGQPTFTDRDLELQGVYHYRVTAVNAHGEGPRSNGACSPPSPAHLLPASGEPCPLVEGWREKVLFRSGDRGLVNVSYRYDPSEATCVRVPPLGASCPAAIPAKADPAWLTGQGWRSEVLVRLRLPDGEHVVRAPFVGQALARP